MLTKLVLLMMTVWPLQTSAEVRTPRDPEAAKAPAMEGLWPSQKLIQLAVVRWCEDIADKYELDDEQRRRYREAEARRWTEFAHRHRADIQPVINEFIEMRMELEPPPKERVQAWAGRATPVFDMVRGRITEATDEFKEVLTPLQRAKFESDLLQLGVGMNVAENKLEQWRAGDFAQEEFWEPTRAKRRKRREQRRRERAAEAGQPTEPKAPEPELDEISKQILAWEEYVRRFIRIYNLDEGQRDAVRSCLAELKHRALAHRDRRREDIARLEERIAEHTGSDKDLAKIKAQLVELYGPVDEMFRELKRRIEQIPTAEQKDAVAKREEDKKNKRVGTTEIREAGESN